MPYHTDPEAILKQIQIGLAAGVDADLQSETNRKMQDAIQRYTDELLTRDLADVKTNELVKGLTFLAKSWDEQVRLTQFVSGKADSRPEIHGSDWLKCLDDAELQQVQRWVEAHEQEVTTHGPAQT